MKGNTGTHVILCLNSGSSSLKFALYRLGDGEEVRLAYGEVERIGLPDGHVWLRDKDNELLGEVHRDFPNHVAAAVGISEVAKGANLSLPDGAGHRVVHGGPQHAAPVLVDTALISELRKLTPFAPLHLPSAIQGMKAVSARFPGLPQVACFDTAFHRSMPEVAQRFPLNREFWDEGIRRYGFHGLSYEFILSTLGAAAKGRLLIAHLGNGASIAAVKNGRPIDTTMGFTPAGGFMMGTRSGDLDPGVLIHLIREKGYDANRLDELLNREAGLQGVSGISSDMKTLLEERKHNSHAAQAVELFCYQLSKHIGALSAVLGGLDTLVFTGGIGEHAEAIRWEVCRELAYLGIDIDPNLNLAHAAMISTPGSPCTVRVIPTNEDLMIARHTYELLFSSMSTVH